MQRIGPQSQACVDGALRRGPDPSLLPEAVARFRAGCRAGDPAACSLLGVMHERGLGLPRDLVAARALQARACAAGNELGCAHLMTPSVPPTVDEEGRQKQILAKK